MDSKEMFEVAQNVNSAVTSDFNLQSVGKGTGALIGMAIGGPAGAGVGAQVGGLVAGFIESSLPKHDIINGSLSSYNFIKMNQKPYYVELVYPSIATQKAISDYYCYYGVPTSRTETINYGLYNYNNHAYIQGNLQYNGTIPLDKFLKIQSIFKRGIHLLYA